MIYKFEAIGRLLTPFKEKFGVPRQSLMMSEATGILKLHPNKAFPAALRHLNQFSHVWILFIFDRSLNKTWHPLIDTPRIDANEKMGVFATRSPHRPNCIGMSVVKLETIDFDAEGGIEVHLSGLDILDGTPVIDIKPYVPYADCIPEANSGWIKTEIMRHPVEFSPQSLAAIDTLKRHPRLRALIQQMLELDPRPTSQRRNSPIHSDLSRGMKFAFRVLDVDVHWEIRDGVLFVENILEQKN